MNSPPRRHDASWRFAALIAALSMLGPFSIDAYLPAFHAIAETFATAPLAVQQTLSIYLFAYAFMMLWHGALSDALGRRAVVLGTLVIFAIATLGCAIAGNIESLWLFRGLQGLSAGAPLVVGRAIIRDRFHGADAQRLMSQVTLVFGIAPAVAPVMGGLLLNLAGWRAIFALLLALVAILIAWVWRALPETLPAASRQPLRAGPLWRNYRAVVTRPQFLLLAAIPAFNFAAFFVYIAAAPAFLIEHLKLSTTAFAWLFVPMIGGIMLGATLSGRLAGRRSPQQTVAIGYGFMFAGVGLNLLVAGFVEPGVPWHVMPILIFCIGSSVVMPSVTLILLDLFPTMRGLASSLQGFIQFALSAVNAGTIAPLLSRSLAAFAAGMALFSLASLTCWVVYQRSSHRATSP